ncbi:MAG TPA: RHS repeat-associated core domain-containing protein [Thermoanaerobaculia bacterium]|jgi:RHS repeat-associated protein
MRRIAAWLLASTLALAASGQQHIQSVEKGFQAEKVYHFGDVDSVNVFNGNLIVTVPIGPAFPLNGGLTYQLRLSYNSKAWDLIEAGGKTHAVPSARSNAGMGWVFGLGRFVPHDDPRNESHEHVYEATDGGDHRFHGDRTRDGSNLRLRRPSSTIAEIDFPDGTVHRFVRNATIGEYQLTEIRGPVANGDKLTISYVDDCGISTPCPPPCLNFDSAWTLQDSRGRKHYVCFRNYKVNDPERPMVEKVVVSATPDEPYTFAYTQRTNISKPPEDTDHSNTWQQTHSAPVLDSVTLPDDSSFAMTSNLRAYLESLTLPTLGTIAYAYDTYSIPSLDFCTNNYGPAFGFGAKTTGVVKRTLTSVVPNGQPADTRVWKYTPDLRPSPSYTSVFQCVPNPELDPTPQSVQLYEELLVTVTDPAGHQVVNHFSVWPGNDHGRFPDEDTSPAGFQRRHYGWPYGPKHETEDLYLSQEFLACAGTSCVPKRSVYVRHEADPEGTPFSVDDPEVPHRQVRQRTIFHDDCPSGACKWAETESSDWDGFGHYRKSKTKGFDADTPERVVETSWNSTPPVGWVLNTYDSVKVTENGESSIEQTCFDRQTGFLRGKRTLLGLAPGPTDLAVVYTADASGNLDTEKYYGGDGASLPIAADLCTALGSFPPTAAYTLSHDWQHGVRSTTQYSGVSWKSLDLTIDAAGRVMAARDPGGFTTAYTYYPTGQLESVTPPGMAKTTYTWEKAAKTDGALTTPANIAASTASASGGIETVYQYDSFGRLWREKSRMPDGEWNLRQTRYDGLDRRSSVSEVVSLAGITDELGYVPQSKTDLAYDSFGRVTRVTPPDSAEVGTVRTEYTGVRAVTRKVRTATGGTSMTDVQTTETYDAQGRLASVTEGGLTTSYTYDIGGRLHLVQMSDGAGGIQSRTFTYDRRGLLASEEHPELGASGYGSITYSNYDARGQARRKTTGPIQLDTVFDAAGRVTEVTQSGVGTLKAFAWDAGYACGSCPGRLAAAGRYNYAPLLGAVLVADTYQYSAAHGKAVRRDQIVHNTASFSGASFFFAQGYDDTGAVSTLSYPCMKDSGHLCRPQDRQRAISYGYTRGVLTDVPGWAGITYQPNGLLATVTHKTTGEVKETWAADPRGMARVRQISATRSGAEIWSTGIYEFDGAGNIRKRGATTYVYDAFQRLAGWGEALAAGATANTRVVYDPFGNLLHTAVQSCAAGGWPCATDMLLSPRIAGTTNHYYGDFEDDLPHNDFVYDAAGNVVSDGKRRFSWDGLGMMTRAEAGGRDFHYLYAADDERIAIIERRNGANKTTYTLRDFGNRALSMWTDDATSGARTIAWKEDTIWRGASLLGNVTPPATGTVEVVKHYFLDHLGSPRLITDGGGNFLGVQEFAPFGGGGSRDGGTLQFTGHERDAAAVAGGSVDLPDYMHARYYDVGRGRFLSVDPTWESADLGKPQTWNRYSYVTNNPVNLTDPDGKCPLCWEVVEELVGGDTPLFEKGYDPAVSDNPPRSQTEFDQRVRDGRAVRPREQHAKLDQPGGPKTGSSGGPGAGKKFGEKTKESARAQSDNKCVFCGTDTTRTPGPNQSNIDHAVAKTRGGNNTLGNAQNTCRTCNLKKAVKDTLEYLRKIVF